MRNDFAVWEPDSFRIMRMILLRTSMFLEMKRDLEFILVISCELECLQCEKDYHVNTPAT